MDRLCIKNTEKSADRFTLGICVGFAVGFVVGASLVAIIDHYDNKKNQLKKIRRDSDENYIYSE